MEKNMSKVEKFIRNNFDLTPEELVHIPRILARWDEEVEESCMGRVVGVCSLCCGR